MQLKSGNPPRKMRRQNAAAPTLLLSEGLAVSALVHCGVAFVGANHNAIQGTIVRIITVVGALAHSAFDTLVCMAAHSRFLLF